MIVFFIKTERLLTDELSFFDTISFSIPRFDPTMELMLTMSVHMTVGSGVVVYVEYCGNRSYRLHRVPFIDRHTIIIYMIQIPTCYMVSDKECS